MPSELIVVTIGILFLIIRSQFPRHAGSHEDGIESAVTLSIVKSDEKALSSYSLPLVYFVEVRSLIIDIKNCS